MNVRNFSAREQLFMCRAQCYQRLTKFKRTLDNLNKAKSELEDVCNASVHRTKRLCKDDVEEDVAKEIEETCRAVNTGNGRESTSLFN